MQMDPEQKNTSWFNYIVRQTIQPYNRGTENRVTITVTSSKIGN